MRSKRVVAFLFGDLIWLLRVSNRLLQKEVAERIRQSAPQYNRLEKGICPPPTEGVIRKLAMVFEVDPEILLRTASSQRTSLKQMKQQFPETAKLLSLVYGLMTHHQLSRTFTILEENIPRYDENPVILALRFIGLLLGDITLDTKMKTSQATLRDYITEHPESDVGAHGYKSEVKDMINNIKKTKDPVKLRFDNSVFPFTTSYDEVLGMHVLSDEKS